MQRDCRPTDNIGSDISVSDIDKITETGNDTNSELCECERDDPEARGARSLRPVYIYIILDIILFGTHFAWHSRAQF